MNQLARRNNINSPIYLGNDSLGHFGDPQPRRSAEVVEAHADVCNIPGSATRDVCSTTWHRSNGTIRPIDPTGMPCENEVSAFVRSGSFALNSIYASHPFQVIVSDVPGDDLGVIQNFRDVVKSAKAEFRGDTRQYTGAFASPLKIDLREVVNQASAPAISVGVYVKLTFQLALAQAPQITIATEGFYAVKGPAIRHVPRSVTIAPKELGLVMEFFLPWFDVQGFGLAANSQIYAPIAALRNWTNEENVPALDDGNPAMPAVSILGLPAGAGTVYAEAVGPYSPTLQNVAGAIGNA